ncbi:unnamed protein product [Spirodela intermedia]|uniref:Uncharacterized protein n=1 Tax=Spirodela intermedia TaxID=51605 RepID=A0A7I8J832_SPIIN|nr:unnamed protein product [Spirodela intermedia]CAA6666249.1 unnamed protein product [Spirodela intermedia]
MFAGSRFSDGGDLVRKMTAHGRAGEVNEAVALFRRTQVKDPVSWNAMLSIFASSGHLAAARNLFAEMPHRNAASYATMIAALSRSSGAAEARRVFDSMPINCHNVFSWTAMITCYTHNREPRRALELFSATFGEFFEIEVLPNSYTFSALLKAAAAASSLAAAKHVHAVVVKLLDEGRCSVYVQNALIHVHARLGNLPDAELVFRRTRSKDLGTCNAMMDAYARRLLVHEAVAIFNSMKQRDVLSGTLRRNPRDVRPASEPEPGPPPLNASSYAIVLAACGTLSRSELGRQVHGLAVKQGFYPANTFVCNSLISMYASCGSEESSVRVFDEVPTRDVVSFNSLILGLGQNGRSEEALEVAERALSCCNLYNPATFVAILTSCSHGGLVRQGLEYFAAMGRRYGIDPSVDHYICVVDLLGRAGRVEEAYELLRNSSLRADSVAWTALLSACLVHGNSAVAESAAERISSMELTAGGGGGAAGGYAMLAVAHARAGRMEEAEKVLDLLRQKGLRRGTGCSWIAPP